MPKYRVLVSRDRRASESVTIEVEAGSRVEAQDKAMELAIEMGDVLFWEADEGNYQRNEPYICDPGNCAEEVEDPANG